VYHVFEKINFDISKCFENIEKNFQKEENILVLFDFEYSHLMKTLKDVSMKKFPNMIISHVNQNKKYQNSKLKQEIQKEEEIKGLCFLIPKDKQLSDYTFLYIGEDSTLLSQIMIGYSSTNKFVRYSPQKEIFDNCEVESSKISKLLLKRYYLVQKAKDAEIIGIIVATFSIGIPSTFTDIKKINTWRF
jgi:diphthamide biosynthesis protein 2